MKNFTCKIDWSKGLMEKLGYGLKHGLWFQRAGEQFFVPSENIYAEFDSMLGVVEIYFQAEKPFTTAASYSILTYGERWATRKEDLKKIYKEDK